jgi:hypothetical protein
VLFLQESTGLLGRKREPLTRLYRRGTMANANDMEGKVG